MKKYRILIVEDEILIADMIERYLVAQGHQVVGKAISYIKAEEMYLKEKPDLALLDIRLSGKKTGIDIARFIQEQPNPAIFIFLTSQMDKESIDHAKETFPAGYLTKPIQKETLFTTIEIAMYSHAAKQIKTEPTIALFDGNVSHLVAIRDILFLRAEHIYVQVHIKGERKITLRSALSKLLEQLPVEQFIQTHRSYAVNLQQVSSWDNQQLFIEKEGIPISRSQRKMVLSHFKK